MYQQTIKAFAPNHNPRHVEAFMRLCHGTLDGLSPAAFAADVRLSCQLLDAIPASEAEDLARSYGL